LFYNITRGFSTAYSEKLQILRSDWCFLNKGKKEEKKTIAKIPPTPRQIFRIHKDKRIKQMEKVKTFSIFPLTNGCIRIQY